MWHEKIETVNLCFREMHLLFLEPPFKRGMMQYIKQVSSE